MARGRDSQVRSAVLQVAASGSRQVRKSSMAQGPVSGDGEDIVHLTAGQEERPGTDDWLKDAGCGIHGCITV